jgi:hypothetical protein
MTIDEKTRMEVEELTGVDTDDFAKRAFDTYYGPLVKRFNKRDECLVLYSTLRVDFP